MLDPATVSEHSARGAGGVRLRTTGLHNARGSPPVPPNSSEQKGHLCDEKEDSHTAETIQARRPRKGSQAEEKPQGRFKLYKNNLLGGQPRALAAATRCASIRSSSSAVAKHSAKFSTSKLKPTPC